VSNNRANNQGAIAAKTSEPTPGEKTSEKTPDPSPDIYRTLIEQQAILGRIKGDGLNNLARSGDKSEEMISVLQTRDALKTHDIRDSCSERLDRLDAKIQSVKEFSQEMKALDRSRQNQRGMEM